MSHAISTIDFMSRQIEALIASPWFLGIIAAIIAGSSVAQYQLNQHERRLEHMDARNQEAYTLLTRIEEQVKAIRFQIDNWKKAP